MSMLNTEHVSRLSKSSYNHSLMCSIIMVILAVISLPKAGNLVWLTPVLSCALALAMLLYTFDPSKPQSQTSTTDKTWLMVWLTYSAWVVIQLTIVPRFVSWNAPANVTIKSITLANSPVNAAASIEAWARFCCYWSMAFLLSRLNIKAIKLCLIIIFAVTLFQSLYGVFAELLGQSTILGLWQKEHYQGSATGSFVNHNHYANYIALATPILMAFLLSQDGPLKHTLHPIYRYLTVLVFCLISATALVASLSRMGLAIGLLGMMAVSYLYLTRYLKAPKLAKLTLASLFIMLLFAALLFFGLEQIIARYERVLIYDMRWEIWSATTQLPLSLWLFGSGGGSFADVFWLVHPPTTPKTAYYAHNDFIQFLLEYGLIGAMLMAIMAIRWFRTINNRGQGLIKSGCLISIVAMLMHSLVDFSLHIPANALLFWFCIGCYFNPNMSRPPQRDISEVISLFLTPKGRMRKR